MLLLLRSGAHFLGVMWGTKQRLRAYLVVGRLVLQTRLVEHRLNLLLVEVGDPDGFHQPGIHQLLHGLSI